MRPTKLYFKGVRDIRRHLVKKREHTPQRVPKQIYHTKQVNFQIFEKLQLYSQFPNKDEKA